MINTIILGHALDVLLKLPTESVSCVITSPPYWRLRNYGIEPIIWDGDKDCNHEFNEYDSKLLHENRQNLDGGTLGNPEYRENLHGFGNAKAGFCLKCGAWHGDLGLEPTFELYVKHLCDIFDEVKRVLRKDGTLFVNIGDSYGGSGNASGHREDTKNLGYKTLEMGATQGNQKITKQYAKCLLDIPYRFSIEMINRGWTKRNTIIWEKPNCMPSSAKDRFTVDFEYIFFFSKSNKTLFWTNENASECVNKQPLGIKGIEGKDWEWRSCPSCLGTGFSQKWKAKDKGLVEIENLHGECGKQGKRIHLGLRTKIPEKQKEICPKCKGLKKVKYSFWTSHDYWFEQQFEDIKEESKLRYDYGFNDTAKRQGLRATGSANHELTKTPSYQGRNKRAVWTIPTQPFPEAHFAVYPETLIEPMIKAGCPRYVCKKCGKARVKILEPTKEYKKFLGKGWHDHLDDSGKGFGQQTRGFSSRKGKVDGIQRYKEIGYTDCGCNAGWESGIVLDPFMGVGTTALVALKQRKRFIGIEIKQEYIDMANKRIARVQQEIF